MANLYGTYGASVDVLGGTTPSYAIIKHAVDQLHIPVNVIIRPRGDDFLYSEYRFEVMKRDVINAQKLGVNGVVLGILQADGVIDVESIAS